MNRAFEAFVRRGLADRIEDGSRVMRSRFPWNPMKNTRSPLEPIMETDVTVLGQYHCMVVDAKYYEIPFIVHPRGGRKLRSGHLYQIAAYLRTLRRHDSLQRSWSACLVYACKDESFDYRIDLEDIKLHVLGIKIEAEPEAILEALGSIWYC